jgi:hypothetical protein
MPFNKTVVIDLDGTIIYQMYPELGYFKDGALEALFKLENAGWRCIVSSCRNNPVLYGSSEEIPQFLSGIAGIFQLAGLRNIEVDDGRKGKPVGKYYVDDQGILFDGDWTSVVNSIEDRILNDNAPGLPTIVIGVEGCIIGSDGNLVSGSRETLDYLNRKGYRTILSTVAMNRAVNDSARKRRESLSKIRDTLDRHRLQYEVLDEGTAGKPVAHCYIESNMIYFQDSWDEVLTVLLPGNS